ncbi:MAG TPA: hypothetical protein PK105_00840 [Rectinema sp.]|nr:hypothetical protein [Rectinema sp.]
MADRKTFAIKGMTCAACVAANDLAVNKLNAVTNISVDSVQACYMLLAGFCFRQFLRQPPCP